MDSYSSTTYTTTAADTGMLAGAMALYVVFIVITYIVSAFLLSRVFKKASVESWIAWVPFYNTWKLLEIGGQKGFWTVLSIIPFVNIVSAIFMIIAMYNIGKKLGKGDAFVLLAIFLPIVWLIILAVDSSTWNESAGAPRLDQPVAPAQPQQTPVQPQADDINTPQPPTFQ